MVVISLAEVVDIGREKGVESDLDEIREWGRLPPEMEGLMLVEKAWEEEPEMTEEAATEGIATEEPAVAEEPPAVAEEPVS